MAQPSRPAQALPAGSWDCHCHVFGPHARFPFAAARRYTPPDVPASALYALHAHLGATHAVLVQAACHGTDHSALLDAIAGSGGRYRGVALLPEDATADTVRQLHEGGVRGARLNFVAHLGKPPSPERLRRVVALIAPFGWHLCVHIDGAALVEWLPELRRLPIPFVVDHLARVAAADGLAQPAMRALLSLAQCANAWVKVSAIDRVAGGQAPFTAGLPYVRAVLEHMPERSLWGSDWPHPNIQGDMPDDGRLVDLFFEACPDAALRQRVLTQNPLALYRD
ncbi:amidohydrolase family protein [Verticiella sediminum]